MVLRHLLEKRDARKEREDELAAELAPYEGYLHQEFERMLAEEREILERHRANGSRAEITLATALLKLPIKSLSAIDDRFRNRRIRKSRAVQFRRQFLEWLWRTTPSEVCDDPLKLVLQYHREHKGPLLEAYEKGFERGRQLLREQQGRHRSENNRNGNQDD